MVLLLLHLLLLLLLPLLMMMLVLVTQTFFMPTKSDEGVRAFRQWIAKFGGKGPRWAVSDG